MPSSSQQHSKNVASGTQDDRVRAILGVRGSRIPPVEVKWLLRYHRYLASTLSFPFVARYHEAVSPLEEITHSVAVVSVIDPVENAAADGLLCRAFQDGKLLELPLVELEVEPHSRNFRLIEDYWYWAWNGRHRGRPAG